MKNHAREGEKYASVWSEEDPIEAGGILKLAGFWVGAGVYGIDIMQIKEVIQAKPHRVHPIPHAPPAVEGVIELRGVILPIMDLRVRFGVEVDVESAGANRLIIVGIHGRILGLRVDRVLGELRVPEASLRPAPALAHKGGPEGGTFSGVCKVDDHVVFVLNLQALVGPLDGDATDLAVDHDDA
ncbi:MAG: chemotaxis protein CheW [Nannocystaceae bacterium]